MMDFQSKEPAIAILSSKNPGALPFLTGNILLYVFTFCLKMLMLNCESFQKGSLDLINP